MTVVPLVIQILKTFDYMELNTIRAVLSAKKLDNIGYLWGKTKN